MELTGDAMIWALKFGSTFYSLDDQLILAKRTSSHQLLVTSGE